jgi:hypothetical protein
VSGHIVTEYGAWIYDIQGKFALKWEAKWEAIAAAAVELSEDCLNLLEKFR